MSKVYTKGGDKGKTALIGGRRVGKEHIRIEAYGTIDELMAHTAMLRDMLEDANMKEQLLHVLDRLMLSASIIACDEGKVPDYIPEITEEDVLFLEDAIDKMDHDLPELKSFVLPGGHIYSSQSHIARTVCRKTERILLRLAAEEPVDEIVLKYFNRLSDYYFLLARKLVNDFGKSEIPWNT